MTADGAVLWDVVEESLDEAEFLVEQWSAAARSARYSLGVLQQNIEHRLVAHLDALAVHGQPVADRLLWPVLAADAEAPAARITAVALALLLDPQVAARDRLIATFATATSEPVLAGLQLAMQLTARDDIDVPLRQALYTTAEPANQTALLAVLAARRVHPGPILKALLARAEPDLARAALSAAAVAAADIGTHRHLVEDRLTHDTPAVRTAALRTAFTWNLAAAQRVCAAEARAGSPTALLLLGLLAGQAEVTLLVSMLTSEQHRRATLFALGFTGRKQAAEACLAFVGDADPAIAKLAAEAFGAITGFVVEDKIVPVDPTVEEVEEPDEEDEHDDEAADEGGGGDTAAPVASAPVAAAPDDLPPLEEDLDTDLGPQPEDELPTPDAAEMRRWWSERADAFAANQRYLGGVLASPAAIEIALRQGSLRRTGPLISEVAIRSGGRVQLPALRLALPAPTLPPDLAMHRDPRWI